MILVLNNKKSQASVDLIIILSFLFIIFLVITAAVGYRNTESANFQTKLYAKSVADIVAAEINSIYNAGAGVTKTVALPESLKDGNTQYNVNIYPSARKVEIVWEREGQTMHYGAPLVTGSFIGNLTNISDDIIVSNTETAISITKQIS